MSEITFNTSPYFDDYDENKNFYRILFKPGVSVQARELTQLQTMLQKQIERHGDHIFKDGAKVVDGELTFTTDLRAIKIESKFGTVSVADYADQLVGVTLVGESTGVRATVVAFSAETATDPLTLFVNYISNGVDKTSIVFADGENLKTETAVYTYSAGERIATAISTDASATGLGCSISTGVYYIKGNFVLVEPQTIVISKYSTEADARIGLQVVESITSSNDDNSLLDNATGSPNFSAPGADRYTIELKLVSLEESSTDDANFIEIERLRGGIIQGKVRSSIYSQLEENLAQRTFDLNGNVEIDPFSLKLKESVNGYENLGVYTQGDTTADGNVATESLMAMQISEGKAYVEGYQLETLGSVFVDVEKARDFTSLNNTSTTLEVGNYVRIENLNSIPDIVDNGGAVTSYPIAELRDTFTSTAGTQSGSLIGYARPRSMEFDQGAAGSSVDVFDSAAAFKMFLFDVNMLTDIALDSAAQSSNILTGTRVQGVNSYASGIVDSASTTSLLKLTGVSGTFQSGEELQTNNYDSAGVGFNVRNSGNTRNVTISSITSNAFDAVKQIYFDDATNDFTSDIKLENEFVLSGTVSVDSSVVTGFNSLFTSELRTGDAISVPSGSGGSQETRIVQSIATDTSLVLAQTVTNNITSTAATRKRAKVEDQDKFLSLRKLPKDFVKDVTDKAIEIRRQFLVTTNTSGVASLTYAGATFNAESNTDYQITVLAPGTGSASAGDIINVASGSLSITGDGTDTLTVASPSIFGDAAQLKITATVRLGSASAKSKGNNKAQLLKVENKKNDGGVERPWGTSAHHESISLGVADAYEVLAVYDSLDTATDAATPSYTVNSIVGTFVNRETVVGSQSGATAIILDTASPIRYVPLSEIEFIEGETITGDGGATGTIGTITEGSTNITNRFFLNDGQKDNYYDISSLVLKPKAAKPVGELLVVFSYFSHGSGEFSDVTSYSGTDYKDIPYYGATRIDPEIRSPSGVYDLRSVVDYRPRVADATGTGDYTTTGFKVTGRSLDLYSRAFSGSGASLSSTPKDNSNFSHDLEYYLPRTDSLFLTTTGNFVVVKGVAEEVPRVPNEINSAIKICDIYMNPYVIDIDNDVLIRQKSYKNFLKEDIARLEDRINNIEYFTSLSLLETSASRLQIKDANGLDRFKTGFLVDNFGGHKTGQTSHPDYRCAIDFTQRTLRPKQSLKNIDLREINLTDAQRSTKNYQRTGDIVTLPYVDVVSIEQPYATRVENLNPVLSFSWTGSITLTPSADEWFEETFLPDITINREGNFNAVLAASRGRLGTVWGATELTWTGREVSTREDRRNAFRTISTGTDDAGDFRIRERTLQSRTIETVTDTFTATRWGLQTAVAERIDTRLAGSRQISNELIPFMRSKTIDFVASGLKPFTRVYPFFDNVDVSAYTSSNGGSVVGSTTTRAVTAGGSWTTLSSIVLKDFWLHNHMGQSKTIKVYYSTTGTGNWVQLGTDFTQSSRTKSDLTIPGGPFAISPNDDGDLWIRIDLEPMEHFSWSDIEFLDQGSTAISRNIIELESFRFTNFGGGLTNTWGFNNNSDEGVFANRGAIPDWNNLTSTQFNALQIRASTARFRIRDGAKTNVPESGTILVTDNSTITTNALVSDATGTVAGKFQIPDPNVVGNPKFRTGTRKFRLTSNSNNSGVGIETFAEADFSSSGILQTRQRTFVATRNAQLVTRRVVDRSTTAQITSQSVVSTTNLSSERYVIRWVDPLAQSVKILSKGGEFLTKIDIFFAAKDQRIPVELQLREMENGIVTNKVIPSSRVIMQAEDILTSANGSVATPFVFSSPLFIAEDVEFAIVLLTDSEEYTVFISKMGEVDLQGGRTVSKQPYLGVLFKSQNSSTWTAYDFEDLKFTLYRAQFETNTNGILELENRPYPQRNLDVDPIECFAGSSTIKVSQYDHHMYNTSNNVEISGVTTNTFGTLNGAVIDTDTEIAISGVTSAWPDSGESVAIRIYNDDKDYVAENDNLAEYGVISEIVTGTMIGTGSTRTITGASRGVSPGVAAQGWDSDQSIELYTYNGIQLQNINKTHKSLIDFGLDYYTLDATNTATDDLTFGGDEVYATENALVSNYQVLIPTNVHTDTTLTPTIEFTSGTSANGTETSFSTLAAENTTLIDNVELSSLRMIASPANEAEEFGGDRSCKVTLTLSTTSDNLSPVVDLERTSVVAMTNRLDNITSSADYYPASEYVAPTAPEGDRGEGIYVTKQVQLKNPATALKVYLDANVFSSSSVQVMFKTLRTDEAIAFEDVGWNYFNTAGEEDLSVSPATSIGQFQEYEYSVDNLSEFVSFAIKIKMNGTDAAVPPVIKDLRAIALAV